MYQEHARDVYTRLWEHRVVGFLQRLLGGPTPEDRARFKTAAAAVDREIAANIELASMWDQTHQAVVFENASSLVTAARSNARRLLPPRWSRAHTSASPRLRPRWRGAVRPIPSGPTIWRSSRAGRATCVRHSASSAPRPMRRHGRRGRCLWIG